MSTYYDPLEYKKSKYDHEKNKARAQTVDALMSKGDTWKPPQTITQFGEMVQNPRIVPRLKRKKIPRTVQYIDDEAYPFLKVHSERGAYFDLGGGNIVQLTDGRKLRSAERMVKDAVKGKVRPLKEKRGGGALHDTTVSLGKDDYSSSDTEDDSDYEYSSSESEEERRKKKKARMSGKTRLGALRKDREDDDDDDFGGRKKKTPPTSLDKSLFSGSRLLGSISGGTSTTHPTVKGSVKGTKESAYEMVYTHIPLDAPEIPYTTTVRITPPSTDAPAVSLRLYKAFADKVIVPPIMEKAVELPAIKYVIEPPPGVSLKRPPDVPPAPPAKISAPSDPTTPMVLEDSKPPVPTTVTPPTTVDMTPPPPPPKSGGSMFSLSTPVTSTGFSFTVPPPVPEMEEPMVDWEVETASVITPLRYDGTIYYPPDGAITISAPTIVFNPETPPVSITHTVFPQHWYHAVTPEMAEQHNAELTRLAEERIHQQWLLDITRTTYSFWSEVYGNLPSLVDNVNSQIDNAAKKAYAKYTAAQKKVEEGTVPVPPTGVPDLAVPDEEAEEEEEDDEESGRFKREDFGRGKMRRVGSDRSDVSKGAKADPVAAVLEQKEYITNSVDAWYNKEKAQAIEFQQRAVLGVLVNVPLEETNTEAGQKKITDFFKPIRDADKAKYFQDLFGKEELKQLALKRSKIVGAEIRKKTEDNIGQLVSAVNRRDGGVDPVLGGPVLDIAKTVIQLSPQQEAEIAKEDPTKAPTLQSLYQASNSNLVRTIVKTSDLWKEFAESKAKKLGKILKVRPDTSSDHPQGDLTQAVSLIDKCALLCKELADSLTKRPVQQKQIETVQKNLAAAEHTDNSGIKIINTLDTGLNALKSMSADKAPLMNPEDRSEFLRIVDEVAPLVLGNPKLQQQAEERINSIASVANKKINDLVITTDGSIADSTTSAGLHKIMNGWVTDIVEAIKNNPTEIEGLCKLSVELQTGKPPTAGQVGRESTNLQAACIQKRLMYKDEMAIRLVDVLKRVQPELERITAESKNRLLNKTKSVYEVLSGKTPSPGLKLTKGDWQNIYENSGGKTLSILLRNRDKLKKAGVFESSYIAPIKDNLAEYTDAYKRLLDELKKKYGEDKLPSDMLNFDNHSLFST